LNISTLGFYGVYSDNASVIKNIYTGNTYALGQMAGSTTLQVGLATIGVKLSRGLNVAKGGNGLNLRPDVILKGGRSGQLVKNLVGPINSVTKGGNPGRVFITNKGGQVIWDITKNRAKSVIPGEGFGGKVTPSREMINFINEIWR